MRKTAIHRRPAAAGAAIRRMQLACYALLGGLFLYALIGRFFLPLYLSEPIGVQPAAIGKSRSGATSGGPASVAAFDDRLDPNTAGWVELTRLPGVGEVTAKRIVAYRQEHGTDSGRPVFSSAQDLARVRGIGPKTVEAIRPYLSFDD